MRHAIATVISYVLLEALTTSVARAQMTPALAPPILSGSFGSPLAASFSHYSPPVSRWGVKLGVLALIGPVGGYPNQALSNSHEPFVTGTLSYRLQAPGKRTLFQPELFLEIGSNLDLKEPEDASYHNYLDQNEAHEFVGLGISNRVSAYLPGGSAFYAGLGGGIYETTSFHLDNTSTEGNYYDQPYNRDNDYSAARLGYQIFAGLQLRRGYYAEAVLQELGSADDYRYRSAGLMLGYRR